MFEMGRMLFSLVLAICPILMSRVVLLVAVMVDIVAAFVRIRGGGGRGLVGSARRLRHLCRLVAHASRLAVCCSGLCGTARATGVVVRGLLWRFAVPWMSCLVFAVGGVGVHGCDGSGYWGLGFESQMSDMIICVRRKMSGRRIEMLK